MSSPAAEPAIHIDQLPRHIARLGRGKEQHRIRDLETGLAARSAGNLAELRLKIAMLSLDGALRPEFEAGVLADAMRLLAARERG